MSGRRRPVRRWAGALAALAAGVVLAARRARLEPMLVQGESMLPTLRPGQRIAVGPPKRPLRRGAVVVVRHPARDGLEVVKRVVGLPGERVHLADGHPDAVLGPDEYLVLGDHREASTDGRAFGPVGWERIVGVVRFAYWPPRRLRVSAHAR
ncbi:MAG TPA: S26 family signal peptidase [Actinomycetota bacterium]|nr:S26 family signal peptidase [Actinomycetota bacterium]